MVGLLTFISDLDQSSRSNVQRPVGTIFDLDVRDSQPHIRWCRIFRDYADDMETVARPGEKLATRVQGSGSPGVPHEDWE